ncbi:MAG: putative glutathione S-transferase [Candidatus Marinamargulisbacteria bacterium]|jgi:putative glutathione S-transferase
MKKQLNDDKGRFVRAVSDFRHWISDAPEATYQPESGRYHLYVSYACPWAHRTLITRSLLGLTDVIGISVVDPFLDQRGWFFSDAEDCIPDTVNHTTFLREIYNLHTSNYKGRVTVPVLWDKKTKTIVNNESREIIRQLNTAFGSLINGKHTLFSDTLKSSIEATLDAIYEPINNGVYKCGFATTQFAYEESFDRLFSALDEIEKRLDSQRYLCGEHLTEADICLFTTLFRFDLVYHTHFKCNLRHIFDYANLWNFVKDIYQMPGVRETCHPGHIKNHYFNSHRGINPYGIVPKGPRINFSEPHNRDRFS